jgi:tripartite-type tricarboxylate transporter receptor subunit TctC
MSVGGATIIVKGDSPHKTLPELLAAAKRENKVLNVGTYPDGYLLVAQWVGAVGGVKINNIPYKGGLRPQTDLAAGQLDLATNDSSGVSIQARRPHPRARYHQRQARAQIRVSRRCWSWVLASRPTFASLFVRAETPDDITNKLVDSVRAAMLSPEGKAYQALNAGGPMMLHTKELASSSARNTSASRKWPKSPAFSPSDLTARAPHGRPA